MKPISLYAMIVSVLVIVFAMVDHLNKKDHQRAAWARGSYSPLKPIP